MMNILFFWIPFISYNKIVYNYYFVGPLGHGLLVALSSVENPWNLEMNDGSIVNHVSKAQSLDPSDYGKTVIADASLQEFIKLFMEKPSVYFKALCLSIKKSFLYELSKWKTRIDNFSEKIQSTLSLTYAGCFFRLLGVFGDIIRLFAWVGLIILLHRKKYIPLIFLMGGVFLGMWVLWISHFEERYVVPFSWPLAVFAAYFFVSAFEWIKIKFKNFKLGKNY